MYEKYTNELEELKAKSLFRSLKPIIKKSKYIVSDDKVCLNLSSNDYLGFAEDSQINSDFIKSYKGSFGSASSRLLTGSGKVYDELESHLAKLYKKEKALLFNSGYHANVGICSALAGKKDVIFSDKLNHASIIDGMQLGSSRFYRYKHLCYEHLEELLQKHRNEYENAIIVSESVFSMDGDITDINKLVELKKKYNAILVIDEAHAFGVFGKNACGVCEVQDCIAEIDVIVATFGKAIASVGAFCVANATIIDYLINKSRSFIFSTALPEVNVAFSNHILKNIIPNTTSLRGNLLANAEKLRKSLNVAGLKTIGASQIVPVILGANEKAVEVSERLLDKGFYLLPIRHPTVAEGTSRIRISLRADVNFEEIIKLSDFINL